MPTFTSIEDYHESEFYNVLRSADYSTPDAVIRAVGSTATIGAPDSVAADLAALRTYAMPEVAEALEAMLYRYAAGRRYFVLWMPTHDQLQELYDTGNVLLSAWVSTLHGGLLVTRNSATLEVGVSVHT